MCTVSYTPGRTGFILTVNRDESPERPTLPPEQFLLDKGKKVYAPRDGLKGGTWVAMDEAGRAVCLLNGAFEKHQRQLPYRKSRGRFVLEAMEATDFQTFINNSQLSNIEPFTMLLFGHGLIYRMVWDGSRKFSWKLPPASNHLWSSPTLYNPLQHAGKERFFKDEMMAFDHQASFLLRIHGSEAATPFILDGPGVRTVSITQLEIKETGARLQYYQKLKPDEKAILISNLDVHFLHVAGSGPAS